MQKIVVGEEMNTEQEKILRAAILSIPGIGSRRLCHILACFGSATAAWAASCSKEKRANLPSWINTFFQAKDKIDPEKIKKKLKALGIALVIPEEDNYPVLLAECSDAPPLLYYKGQLLPRQEGLAIVGTRRASAYGKAAAAFLAREIVEMGYVVVSGLATGIDTAAHQGALKAKGTTWAFLAGGLDSIYPPENFDLAKKIIENKGALISECPVGKPVKAGNFPIRNRLISGCSRGVIIVEAARKSGSLITADFALEQGREVFAVPGPIFNKESEGTHHLIKIGAKLVTGKEDILSELPPPGNPKAMIN
jgi:DNA processing protein